MSTHPTGTFGTPAIETTRWRLDPRRSSVEFQVKAFWGMSTVKGSFSAYRGALDLRSEPAVELTVEAASLDTANAKRDTHLRSPDFFDAERHPEVRFVSETGTLDGERLSVHGRLLARGASMPLNVDATLRRAGDELEVEAVTIADHHQLGMTWNKLRVLADRSTLIVKGRLVRDV